MIFVLALFVLIGFCLTRFSKKKLLKAHFKYVRFVPKHTQFFFDKKWQFACAECKELLGQKSLTFLKKLDDVLCRVRYGCPKGGFGLEMLGEYGIALPIFLLANGASDLQLQILALAKQMQEMSVVVFEDEPSQKNKDWPQFIFLNASQKQLLSSCKNWCVPPVGFVKLDGCAEGLSFRQQSNKQKMLASGYLLSKSENKQFCFFEYEFFVGQKVCAVVVQNKQNHPATATFHYAVDFAKQSINYHRFSRHKNHVVVQNLVSDEVSYVCYSVSPTMVSTSLFLGKENSNLPCVKTTYIQTIKANESKTFLFSQGAFQTLIGLTLDVLEQLSASYMASLFFATITTQKPEFNQFFNQTLKQKAMQEVFEYGLENEAVQGSVEQLITQFEQGAIGAAQCYFSIQKQFVVQRANAFAFCPFSKMGDYQVTLWTGQQFKNILFCKKNVEKPCLVVDGVCYVGQLEIAKKHLLSMQKIEVQF